MRSPIGSPQIGSEEGCSELHNIPCSLIESSNCCKCVGPHPRLDGQVYRHITVPETIGGTRDLVGMIPLENGVHNEAFNTIGAVRLVGSNMIALLFLKTIPEQVPHGC